MCASGTAHPRAETPAGCLGCAGSSTHPDVPSSPLLRPPRRLARMCPCVPSSPDPARERCRTLGQHQPEPSTHNLANPNLPHIHPQLLEQQETNPSSHESTLPSLRSSSGNAGHISQLNKLEPFAQGKEKEAAPTGLGVNSWQGLYFSSPVQPQLVFPLVSYLCSQEVSSGQCQALG